MKKNERKPEGWVQENVPAAYQDCNGLNALGDCRILTEQFCVSRGSCKFYKAKPADGGAKNE